MDKDFHFYHELKKEKYYDPLIPKKEAGLVIILLYEQWKSGKYDSNNFTEAAVKSAIEQVASDLGNKYERKPHERFKEVNIRLQEYFLLRNENTNRYNITQYGIEFCERIHEKLVLEFKPTDIEKILADLIESLKSYIEKGDFPHWYNYQYAPQRINIKNQVETLYRKVEDSVREFRTATKLDDKTFLEIVRKVDVSLGVIGKHSQELKDAFWGAEDIKGLLLQLSFDTASHEISFQKESVRLFIEEINNDLRIINQRIDRIRPKLRQFITSINQRNFDRNTELFLRLLLNKSGFTKNGNKKKIKLPKGINSNIIFQPESDFTIVEEGRLQPKQPIPIYRPKQNDIKKQKQLEKAEIDFFIRNRIRYWLKQLKLELHENGVLDFTPTYFAILDKEKKYKNTIAIKVASGLFRKYTKLRSYKVTVEKTMMTDMKHSNLAIWKMKICKRK